MTPGRTDRAWLKSNSFSDFDDVKAAMTETDGGVLLDLGVRGSIFFEGLTADEFHEDDFII